MAVALVGEEIFFLQLLRRMLMLLCTMFVSLLTSLAGMGGGDGVGGSEWVIKHRDSVKNTLSGSIKLSYSLYCVFI